MAASIRLRSAWLELLVNAETLYLLIPLSTKAINKAATRASTRVKPALPVALLLFSFFRPPKAAPPSREPWGRRPWPGRQLG